MFFVNTTKYKQKSMNFFNDQLELSSPLLIPASGLAARQMVQLSDAEVLEDCLNALDRFIPKPFGRAPREDCTIVRCVVQEWSEPVQLGLLV